MSRSTVLSKASTLPPSVTSTCNFVLAQLSTVFEQFRLPNVIHTKKPPPLYIYIIRKISKNPKARYFVKISVDKRECKEMGIHAFLKNINANTNTASTRNRTLIVDSVLLIVTPLRTQAR